MYDVYNNIPAAIPIISCHRTLIKNNSYLTERVFIDYA